MIGIAVLKAGYYPDIFDYIRIKPATGCYMIDN
jgi:hypothetical protein